MATPSKKILVIEDDPVGRRMIGDFLAAKGYHVLWATNGSEGVEMARMTDPDLVLCDVLLPRKSGFEVCSELRADEAIRDTLVLMLTAKGRDTDVAKGLGVGADAYMTKPFSTKELAQKVAELLAAGRKAA